MQDFSLLPQSLELEEAILGSILFDPEAIARVYDFLMPEAFYISAHQDIYTACRRLHELNSPTDAIFVCRYLEDLGLLQKVGGRNKIAQLLNQTVSAISIDIYAKTIIAKYQKRQLIKACQEIISQAQARINSEEESQEVANLLNLAQQKIQQIEQINNPQNFGLKHVSEICPEVYSEMQEIAEGTKKFTKTGFYDLDAVLDGGLREGNLSIVMARPSMGKTSFMINTALNVLDGEQSVAMFSLEMSQSELIRQAIAIKGNICRSQIQQAKFDAAGWDKFLLEIQQLSTKHLYIDQDSQLDLAKLTFRCRSLVKDLASRGQPPLSLILIDYLQLMVDRSKNQLEAIGIVSSGLKKLSKEIGVPIVCLSQLSRSVESRDNKRPTMSDIRASGYVEEDSDVIIGLYRDEYYHPDSPDRGITELCILKNRSGVTGTVKLLFDPGFGVFKNLARPKY